MAIVSLAVAGCARSNGSLWNRFAKADSRFKSAKRELKDPSHVHLKWAQLQEQSGNVAESRQSYEFVLAENAKSVDAILGLARLDQLAGRTAEAEQGFQKALKLKPNAPQVLDAVGQFYASQEKWDLAVQKLNAAMLAAPDEPNYRYHLAVALARSGDLEGSLPHFAKTIGEAEAHYNIGYILHQQGQLAAAEQQFQQAVLKKPGLHEAQEMLDDIRRTQEGRLMLTGSRTGGPSAVVPSGGALPQHNYAGTAPTYQPAAGVAHVPSAHLQSPPRSAATSATVHPGASGFASAPGAVGTATVNGSYQSQPAGNFNAYPANAYPAAPGGMTPQQLEQMRNQLGGR
jgi:tetratricopeptide (TPR) repeat protein